MTGSAILSQAVRGGGDTLAAQTVLLLKEKYPHIKLKIALPFANPFEHEKDWSGEEIDAFFGTSLFRMGKMGLANSVNL